MKLRTGHLISIILVMVIAAACVHKKVVASVPESAQPQVISMQASNHKFNPNDIKAVQGQTLVLRVQNVSSNGHNISIKNPAGQKIVDQGLPAGKTVEVTVKLDSPGTYDFWCNVDMHSSLGMKGKIEVAGAK